MFWIFLQNAGSQLCFRHSLCIRPLPIKLYCIVLYCIVLYFRQWRRPEETRGRTSQGSGETQEAAAKGAGETGELFVYSDSGLTHRAFAHFWRHRTVLMHFFLCVTKQQVL